MYLSIWGPTRRNQTQKNAGTRNKNARPNQQQNSPPKPDKTATSARREPKPVKKWEAWSAAWRVKQVKAEVALAFAGSPTRSPFHSLAREASSSDADITVGFVFFFHTHTQARTHSFISIEAPLRRPLRRRRIPM